MTQMRRLLPYVLFGLLALVMLLAVLPDPLAAFPSLDSGYYLYIGQQILQGKIPYLDLWESKPPGIFYLNAFGLWLGRGTRWGVWGLELFFLLISAALSFLILKKKSGFFSALFGSAIWIWGLQGTLQGGNLTEEYSLPFGFAAIGLFGLAIQAPRQKRYPFWIGMSFSFSFLLRANNAGAQAAIVLAWLVFALWQRDWRLLFFRLFWSGLAAALTLGAVALLSLWQGNLREMIEAALLFNFYLTGAKKDFLASLLGGINFIGIPAGLALLGYLFLLITAPKKNEWILFLLILFPLEIFLAGLSGRGYPHYYISWMPAIGLLAAELFESLPQLSARLERRRFLVSLSIFWVVSIILGASLQERSQNLYQFAFQRQSGVEIGHPVANYLRENTTPEQTVLIWGGRLAFNYLARRASPSSVLFYPLLVDSPLSTKLSERFLAEITARPPALIVDTHAVNQDLLPALAVELRLEQEQSGKLWQSLPENISEFYKFVAQNYQVETTLGDYVIYRLQTP
jgi:hypothetical protein